MPFSAWAILFPPHGVVLSVQILNSLGSELALALLSTSYNSGPFTAGPWQSRGTTLTIPIVQREFFH